MAVVWIENGPISVPARPLAYAAAVAVFLCALLGVGMGFEASFRRGGAPDADNISGQSARQDDALVAKPIVDLAPPTAAPAATQSDDQDDSADAKADALAAQTAAAQAIQAKPSKAGGDIDDVLASPTEKPPAPAKAAADESPPGTPVKSDVPF
jgi:hypothetical protein